MTQHAEPHHDPRFEDPRTEADDNWMPPELPNQTPHDQQPDPERADWMPPPEHRPPSLLDEPGSGQPPARLDPTATMPPADPPAAPPMPDSSLRNDWGIAAPPRPSPGPEAGIAQHGALSPTDQGPALTGAVAPRVDPLWPDAEVARFEGRWREVQLGFVDDPRHAADEARALLDDVVDRLTQAITDRRSELDSWRDGGCEAGDDTEAMLGAVRRYRRLMDQLLAVGHPR